MERHINIKRKVYYEEDHFGPVGVAIIAPTSNAEAQALGNHCCTSIGVCQQVNVTPINTSCFCATPAGPVYGLTC